MTKLVYDKDVTRSWWSTRTTTSFPRAVRCPGWRLGSAHLQRDGAPGTGGLAGHPPQPSGKRAAGNRQSHPQWRSSTRWVVCWRERGVRFTQKLLGVRGWLSSHHGDAPANFELWSGGLARRLCGFHVRLQRWRASELTHQGRGSRQRHAVLVNEHRSLFRPNLLGERQQKQYECFGAEDSGDLAPRCGDRVSRRDLPCAEELDPACLSKPRLFQRGRQGRALRGLGKAATFF